MSQWVELRTHINAGHNSADIWSRQQTTAETSGVETKINNNNKICKIPLSCHKEALSQTK